MSLSLKQKIGLFFGPALALLLLLFFDLKPGEPLVTRTAAVVVLMALWWITEAIPIPATALIPIALYPLMGIMQGNSVAGLYFNHIIFLFIGGFIMALAMQRWKLHRRIALRIIFLIGASPRKIILGFMAATFFLSMWISNTATTMMIVPMALAIIYKLKETFKGKDINKFSVGLLIGIAYAASIGGIATLIGTPPNLSFARIFQIYFPKAPEISFTDWFVFATPLAVIFLLIAWYVLSRFSLSGEFDQATSKKLFREEYAGLGRISYEESIVLTLFSIMALLLIFRQNIDLGTFVIPGWSNLFPVPKFIDDGTIAISIALLLFIIPAKSSETRCLMNWKTASKLNWGIVLLFGGGFALASGFKESGLSQWLGESMSGVEDFPPLIIVASVCTTLTFLTELTSNTATTEIFLPILGSLSATIKVNPLLLMIPATLSASCAFMLPVATPPNAIVFGSGEIAMKDMIKFGIILNLIGIILITSYMFLIGVIVFNIDLSTFPEWAL